MNESRSLTQGRKIRLSLISINDERKTCRILSAKACGGIYHDTVVCSEGAMDICFLKDVSMCAGSGALDYCKYVDEEACVGTSAYDYCLYDYHSGPGCGYYDYCKNVDL